MGDKGKVLAVDIQPKCWTHEEEGREGRRENLELIKGTETDPKLPKGEVDLILLVDVYHEFSHPYEMAEKMVAALKPGGRLASSNSASKSTPCRSSSSTR